MLQIKVPYHILIRNYWDLLNQFDKSETLFLVLTLCKLLSAYQGKLNPKEIVNYTSLRVDRIIDGISTTLPTFGPKESNFKLTRDCKEMMKAIRDENERIQPQYRSNRRI